MSNYQYRVSGRMAWQSNSGNAILALINKIGSNKKIVLKSFEVTNLSSTSSSATPVAALPTLLTLSRSTVTGGEQVTPLAFDTAASFPSSILIKTRANTTTNTDLARISTLKQNVENLAQLGRSRSYGKFFAAKNIKSKDSSIQDVTVKEGESVSLWCSTLNNSTPLRVSAVVQIDGTPARLYSVQYFTHVLSVGDSVFSIENTVSSGYSIKLKSVSVEEVGTFDSPYLQLVPIASTITESSTPTQPVVLSMDTDSPSPSSWLSVYADVPVLPFGVPENYLADSSTGSPKGFNYLKTKDFLGPVYRTLFPEYVSIRNTAFPDTLGSNISHSLCDIGIKASGVTVREGEGIALCSAAETAAGATTAVGVSGWSVFEFAMIVSVEPKLIPTLTITGLKPNSEVRVFAATTTTEVAGDENIVGGVFAWEFDPEVNASVDISILSLGYQNTRITGLPLTLSDVTIPVQQQLDRQYSN